MDELTRLLEQHLEGLRREMSVTAGSGIQDLIPGLIPEPAYVRPALQPHLGNAIRRLNEVIREQAYAQWWQSDEGWALGHRMQAGMRRNLSIGSVAFLGKTGSHSNRSALEQYPEATMQPVGSFQQACQLVIEGGADAAVLPIDNSTAGTIGDVYDLLLRHDLHIVRGASLPIRNVLLGVPGALLADVREVWTHPQPILQCAGFLRDRGLQTVAMDSTAAAAEAVSRNGEASVAAIGSREAAVLYGLEVLAEEIDDMATNRTRFVTVARDLVIPPDATRVSLVFTVPHESGSLSGVLSRLADFGLNVVKIQSRPIPHRAWEYSFHLDFESRVENMSAFKALYMLDHELPYLKLLGWYAEQPEA